MIIDILYGVKELVPTVINFCLFFNVVSFRYNYLFLVLTKNLEVYHFYGNLLYSYANTITYASNQ